MVFVMLSGHGFQVEKYGGFEPYVGFAPADAKASVETGVEFASSISLSRFFAELKDCDATFKWALIDACRENLDEPSPDSQMRTRGAGGAARAKALRELEAPRGGAIMQNCGAGEFSWEDAKYGHGLFARAFAESLTELGDANQDGKVTFLEASTRTIREVKTETETNRERYATVQRPYLSGDLTDFVLTEVETSAPKAGARKTATIAGVEFAFRFVPRTKGARRRPAIFGSWKPKRRKRCGRRRPARIRAGFRRTSSVSTRASCPSSRRLGETAKILSRN